MTGFAEKWGIPPAEDAPAKDWGTFHPPKTVSAAGVPEGLVPAPTVATHTLTGYPLIRAALMKIRGNRPDLMTENHVIRVAGLYGPGRDGILRVGPSPVGEGWAVSEA